MYDNLNTDVRAIIEHFCGPLNDEVYSKAYTKRYIAIHLGTLRESLKMNLGMDITKDFKETTKIIKEQTDNEDGYSYLSNKINVLAYKCGKHGTALSKILIYSAFANLIMGILEVKFGKISVYIYGTNEKITVPFNSSFNRKLFIILDSIKTNDILNVEEVLLKEECHFLCSYINKHPSFPLYSISEVGGIEIANYLYQNTACRNVILLCIFDGSLETLLSSIRISGSHFRYKAYTAYDLADALIHKSVKMINFSILNTDLENEYDIEQEAFINILNHISIPFEKLEFTYINKEVHWIIQSLLEKYGICYEHYVGQLVKLVGRAGSIETDKEYEAFALAYLEKLKYFSGIPESQHKAVIDKLKNINISIKSALVTFKKDGGKPIQNFIKSELNKVAITKDEVDYIKDILASRIESIGNIEGIESIGNIEGIESIVGSESVAGAGGIGGA